MGKLISAPEAAEILGVHRATVILWANQGKITAQQYVGSGPTRPRPLFDTDYIVALAEQRNQAKHPETLAAPVAA